MSKFPAIPDFANSLDSMAVTLRALKDSVEQLTGHRQGAAAGVPALFDQVSAPAPGRQTVLTRGDLWIHPETHALSYWTGNEWKLIRG